jgi:hypothetical protein
MKSISESPIKRFNFKIEENHQGGICREIGIDMAVAQTAACSRK